MNVEEKKTNTTRIRMHAHTHAHAHTIAHTCVYMHAYIHINIYKHTQARTLSSAHQKHTSRASRYKNWCIGVNFIETHLSASCAAMPPMTAFWEESDMSANVTYSSFFFFYFSFFNINAKSGFALSKCEMCGVQNDMTEHSKPIWGGHYSYRV